MLHHFVAHIENQPFDDQIKVIHKLKYASHPGQLKSSLLKLFTTINISVSLLVFDDLSSVFVLLQKSRPGVQKHYRIY